MSPQTVFVGFLIDNPQRNRRSEMSNHSINDTQGKGKGEGAVERNTSRQSENQQPDDKTNKDVGGILDKK